MTYYICNYADYSELPEKLFCDHSPNGQERQSLDGLKFIARCKDHSPAEGCFSWMNGDEQGFNHSEILTQLSGPEWTEPEE